MLGRRYELFDKIGNGAFGEVHRAKDRQSGEPRAIKRVRVNDDGQLAVLPAIQFQEIETLRQLQHPNIVKLLDVVPDKGHLALVFEYMPHNLVNIVRSRSTALPPADIRGLFKMLLHGVAWCHDHKILHRDLKPSNVLLSAEGIVKLCDFGLATVFLGHQARNYSHQVATRWYRAPELLFGARQYDFAIDMWAIGTIFAEFLRSSPLFPGQNDLDQIFRILQVCGDIDKQWPAVRALPDFHKVSFPSYQPISLARLFPDAEASAVDLLSKLLALDPSKRLSARQALAHDFFFQGPVHCYFSYHVSKTETERQKQEFRASLGQPFQLDEH